MKYFFSFKSCASTVILVMCTLSLENKKLEVMGTLINSFFLQANFSGGYTLKLLT